MIIVVAVLTADSIVAAASSSFAFYLFLVRRGGEKRLEVPATWGSLLGRSTSHDVGWLLNEVEMR
jgi:hypothetical protein